MRLGLLDGKFNVNRTYKRSVDLMFRYATCVATRMECSRTDALESLRSEDLTAFYYRGKLRMTSLSAKDLSLIHTSFCCRAEPFVIRSGMSMVFSMFHSYAELNFSNLIMNQEKILLIRSKVTVVIKFFCR